MPDFVAYKSAEVPDDAGVSIPMMVFYPTLTEAKEERLGPYLIELALDADIKPGTFPLALISHGGGGTPLVYRTLAHHLAANGFLVGLPEHPFNNRRDNSLGGKMQNLINRPRHICACLKWFFETGPFAIRLQSQTASLIGHSMGCYSVLAAAGGNPTCFAKESNDGMAHQLTVMHDDRIKNLVLLAPAAVWFREPGALVNVTIPILLIVAEKDVVTTAFHHDVVLRGVPDRSRINFREIKNAGHFSFLSPFPPMMTRPTLEPSQDPLGFDRAAFQQELARDILAFL